MEKIKNFLDFPIITLNQKAEEGIKVITSFDVLWGVFIMFITWVLWVAISRYILKPFFKSREVEEGRSFAIRQLLKYSVFLLAFIIALESIGFNMSILLGAGAALLVGIGIGLQQTFNDVMSGIILLTEGSVQKGDWLQVDDMIGQVQRIGLRTSTIETKRNVTVIVPNSKITVDNVINFSHHTDIVRYTIDVGVAYGSDVQLVRELLLEAAGKQKKVLKTPPPFVRFEAFGDSSLNFGLRFWSREYIRIEDVQSDIRFEIDALFREHGVVIPFPQRDLHLKTDERPDSKREIFFDVKQEKGDS